MGRPKDTISLYDKYVKGREDIIKADCRNGADNKGLAARLGIGLTTYKRLKNSSPEFTQLIKEGKAEADLKVENALFKRAVGYDVEETTTEVRVGEDGSAQTTYVKKTKKHIAGDTTAQIFWLKNRKPQEWRDRQDVNIASDEWVDALKQLNEEYENGDA